MFSWIILAAVDIKTEIHSLIAVTQHENGLPLLLLGAGRKKKVNCKKTQRHKT